MRCGSAAASFSRCFWSCWKSRARFSSGSSAMRLAISVSVISNLSLLQLAQQPGQQIAVGPLQPLLDDGLSEAGHRRGLERGAQGELDAEGLLHARQHLGGEQGMAAQLEEAVAGAH